MWLAMTTNERLNSHRYKYFHEHYEHDHREIRTDEEDDRCKHKPKSPFK